MILVMGAFLLCRNFFKWSSPLLLGWRQREHEVRRSKIRPKKVCVQRHKLRGMLLPRNFSCRTLRGPMNVLCMLAMWTCSVMAAFKGSKRYACTDCPSGQSVRGWTAKSSAIDGAYGASCGCSCDRVMSLARRAIALIICNLTAFKPNSATMHTEHKRKRQDIPVQTGKIISLSTFRSPSLTLGPAGWRGCIARFQSHGLED